MMTRNWFWQLQAAQHGPDWFFSATFAPTDATQLAARIRQHPLAGLRHYRVTNGPCRQHQHTSTYDLYADQANYAALKANFESDTPQNIWIYHAIEVCGSDLRIERGYGGYPDLYDVTETDLIVMLAHATDLTLLKWDVGYSGDGYPTGSVATGTTAIELLAYLQAA